MRYGNFVGLEYLKAFFDAGIAVDAVVFQGDVFDPKERQILAQRTNGRYQSLFVGDVLNGKSTQIYYLKKHNSIEGEKLLTELKPDLIVLGGTDILQDSLLQKAAKGVLNCHPGLLPEYRGCSCVEWSILNDDPVGAACHLATKKIDAGPVIYQEPMTVFRSDDYASIRTRMISHLAHVMTSGVKKILTKPAGWPAPSAAGTYYHVIDEENMLKVLDKIKNKTYRHMTEGVCV